MAAGESFFVPTFFGILITDKVCDFLRSIRRFF